jgi:hypothetical protein
MANPDPTRATADVKARCERVAVALTSIARQPDAVFAQARDVMLNLTLAEHEIAGAAFVLRTAFWP